MIHLMTSIRNQIDDAHEYETYQAIAPQGARYPYVVYKLLPVENTEKNRDDYTLEISCWDKSESTSHVRVAVLADKVRKALVNYREVDDHNLIMASRPSIGYVPDPDGQIKRYDVTTTLMTYRRE